MKKNILESNLHVHYVFDEISNHFGLKYTNIINQDTLRPKKLNGRFDFFMTFIIDKLYRETKNKLL